MTKIPREASDEIDVGRKKGINSSLSIKIYGHDSSFMERPLLAAAGNVRSSSWTTSASIHDASVLD